MQYLDIQWHRGGWAYYGYIADGSRAYMRTMCLGVEHLEKKDRLGLLKNLIASLDLAYEEEEFIVSSSIDQLRVLGLDLTEEEDSLGLEPGTWKRIGEAYAKAVHKKSRKIDLSHINPHMNSRNPPLTDEEEPETWTVGTGHGSVEWFDDETLEKEYNEMLEECKEDFGINTAEKVDGAKALDILKSLI